MIIGLVNKKGGAGKTTSCAYIAMCLHAIGHKVTGIDTDNNKSFHNWSNHLPFDVLLSDRNKLNYHLENIEGYVVIDTPPNDGEIIYKVAMVADEVIVPLSPTALDINQIKDTLDIIADIEKVKQKEMTSVLLTSVKKQRNISTQAKEDLQNLGVPVCDNYIRDLNAYVRMDEPTYLEEYQSFLKEIEVL